MFLPQCTLLYTFRVQNSTGHQKKHPYNLRLRLPGEYNEASETLPTPRFTSARGNPRAAHYRRHHDYGYESSKSLIETRKEVEHRQLSHKHST